MMKKHSRFQKIICIFLSLLFCLQLFGCSSSSGKTLMSLGKQKLSVNTYNLLLSRMKGTLSYNEYPVDSSDFWDTIWSTDGATYNDYFCSVIQDEAKLMLSKLYLFDEVYKLSLPEDNYTDIDDTINEILDFYFDGSKTAFNAELSAFGVNMKMLREEYIIEDKIAFLNSYISSITGDSARDEYYNNNFICFRQILFPLYDYVYETDENGDTIFYVDNSGKIYYDTVNGKEKSGTDGKTIVDSNGDTVYFLSDGRIAYNTDKGIPRGIDKDNDGYVDYELMDDAGKQAVKDRAEKLMDVIDDGDFTTFEMYGNQMSEDDVWTAYPGGIFTNMTKTYSEAYINQIQEQLKEAQPGKLILILSDNAYHLIMKYPLESGAYSKNTNQDWFDTFEEDLADSILSELCEKYKTEIAIDDEVLKTALNMKTVGSNFEY